LNPAQWLQEGAEHEDDGTKMQFIQGTARSINHFHVPTTTNPAKATLETAGLSDLVDGMSAILWAQTGTYQNTIFAAERPVDVFNNAD
jgi:hypothetical protein